MNRVRRGARRGLTLLELLVSAAVGAIAMAAVASVFIAQVRSFHAQEARRSTQSSGRQSLSAMEDVLRMAGYGVDPPLAIFAFDGFNPDSPDAADLNYPDAIVVHHRDLLFARTLTNATSGQLTINPALTSALVEGQILLALCPGATTYAYVVLGANAAAGTSTLTLAGAASGADTPFSAPGNAFRQQALLDDPCFDSGTLVKVERYAFYLDNQGGESYLMQHRGLNLNILSGTGIDRDDGSPVAPGVEQLQIAYVMNAADGVEPAVLGATTSEVPGWGDAWRLATPTPSWNVAYDDAARTTRHPANIRQVRVTLITRSPTSSTDTTGDDFNHLPDSAQQQVLSTGTVAWQHFENLGTAGTAAIESGYLRSVYRTSVSPKNLLMRSQFTPLFDRGG